MGSVRTTFRAIVAAGLIVSLGFTGICAADATLDSLLGQSCPTSQARSCVVTTLDGNCESACHCGQQLPQKDNYPAPNNGGQPSGLAVDIASLNGTAAATIQALDCPALLSGGNSSLLAQGTRLNC